MAQALTQSDALQQVAGVFAGIFAAFQLHRQHDVFQCVKAVEQLKGLKHKADMFGANPGALVFVQGAQRAPCEDDFACTGQVEPGQ